MRESSERARFLDAFLAGVGEYPSLRAVWLDGRDRVEARDPAGDLDLHVAVEDPEYDAAWGRHETLLARSGRLAGHCDAEAPVDARACAARLDGAGGVRLTVERASLLAKRRRAFVLPLLDRSGQFRYVLSYERRGG